MRQFMTILASLLLFGLANGAHAATTLYEDVPTDWFIVDYIGSPAGVVLLVRPQLPSNFCYNSTFGSAALNFPNTVTDNEVNRFWSSVISAKATSTKVGVYYDNGTCIISNFFVPNLGG